MMEFWHNFSFIRPYLLILALLPATLYFLYFQKSSVLSSWRKVVDEELLDYLLVKGSSGQRRFYIFSSLAALTIAAIIAAGPSWEEKEIPQLQKQNPVFVILNLSSDIEENDLKPSRLDRAKYKIKDFLSMLKSAQTAMMVYSSEPFIITPFTQDTRLLQNLLGQIGTDIMPTNGDRLDRAIALAVEHIKSSGYDMGSLVIFAADAGQKFDLAIEQAKEAASQNVKVNIIGVSNAHNEKLLMIAQAGEGSYWQIQSNDEKIAALASKINDVNAPFSESKNQNLQKLDGGWCFLIIPLLGCLLLFRKGLLIVLPALLLSSPASAGFFTNADQDGYQAFQKGDFASSSQLFNNNNWRAASLYRLGDYEKAYKLYSQDNSIEGLYNQGNALAKSGHIKEAISKYEEVLKLNPQHQDAEFNLEYLKKQQEQQNQQNQQNQDQQNQSDQNNQSSADNDNNNSDDNQNEQSSSSAQSDQNENQSQEQNNQSSAQNDQSQNNSQSDQQTNPQQNDNSDKQSEGQEKVDTSSDNRLDEKTSQSSSESELDQDNTSDEGENQPSLSAQELAQEGEDYDEKLQAKAQQYREIPEDVGGLLRAFIKQEYQKNRYNEN